MSLAADFTRNIFTKISLILLMSISLLITDVLFKNNIKKHFQKKSDKDFPKEKLLLVILYIFLFFFASILIVFFVLGMVFTFFNEQLDEVSFDTRKFISDTMKFTITTRGSGESIYNVNFLILMLILIVMSIAYFIVFFLNTTKGDFSNEEKALANYKGFSRKIYVLIMIIVLLI